jgi:carbon monoxide dehydrogenase subunit G
MPTVTRTRTVPAPPDRVWSVVANPERLVEWWPRVQRVEDVDAKAWTTVLASEKGGRTLRADYTLLEEEPVRRRAWRHEIAASPFERILTSSVTEIELEAKGDGQTAVTLTTRLGLRGLSKLGGWQVRRATRKTNDGALDGLGRVVRGGGA